MCKLLTVLFWSSQFQIKCQAYVWNAIENGIIKCFAKLPDFFLNSIFSFEQI